MLCSLRKILHLTVVCSSFTALGWSNSCYLISCISDSTALNLVSMFFDNVLIFSFTCLELFAIAICVTLAVVERVSMIPICNSVMVKSVSFHFEGGRSPRELRKKKKMCFCIKILMIKSLQVAPYTVTNRDTRVHLLNNITIQTNNKKKRSLLWQLQKITNKT